MKYKVIIQELKASNDKNVRAFGRDMEKLKPLTKKERDFYLQNRYNPVAKEKLIADFIPYIIMVAYAHSEKTAISNIIFVCPWKEVGYSFLILFEYSWPN